MAMQTGSLQEAISDFASILPEIGAVIAAKGSNVSQDITTVEHVAGALVSSAAKIGVPYAGTVETFAPLAHQLVGLFATWMAGKSAAAPKA